MTVRELMVELSQCDPEKTVCLYEEDDEDCLVTASEVQSVTEGKIWVFVNGFFYEYPA